jgi:hypothetical protein
MITEYEHLQNERPHIAAAVKRECSIITAFNVLQALDIQEREIQRLKEINAKHSGPSAGADGCGKVNL